VLLVDDWDTVTETLLNARQQHLLDRLVAVVKRAHERELRVVVAGPRSTAGGALTGVFSQRLLLLPADPIDLAMAGLSSRVVPPDAPPGRALEVASGREVQVAVPARVFEQCIQRTDFGAGSLPTPVPELPEHVELEGLPSEPATVVIGMGADGPVGLVLRPGQRRVAVLGRAASGRSTALTAIAAGLRRLGRTVALVSPEGRAPVAGITSFGPHDVDALVTLRRDHPSVAVLVDDADDLAGTPIEPVLTEIARLADADDGFVAVAATTRHAADRPASLAGQVAAGGCGLLLGSLDPRGEQVLGARGLVPHGNHPGRGHLVRDGSAEVVQVAWFRLETSGATNGPSGSSD
jgi:S-DNA-T family DNA segregation ATPase FtsK/SpoIIIE